MAADGVRQMDRKKYAFSGQEKTNEQAKDICGGQDNETERQRDKNFKTVTKRIVFAALFAALCWIGTSVFIVPLPYGYFNMGDVFVLLAGWCLGPVYGAVAAALGSGLADILSGYVIYAPVTFLVKGCMAAVAYILAALLKKAIKRNSLDFLVRGISAFCAEILMVSGYFLYETALYGIAGGAASVVGNLLQGCFGMVCAVILAEVLRSIRPVNLLFPKLDLGMVRKKANLEQK